MPLALRPKMCMSCFQEYYLGNTKIVKFENANQTLRAAPQPGTMAYFLSRVWVQPLLESQYPGQQPRRACPHCGELLPANTENVDSKVIAIIGASNVGKSHYTAVLINQLLATTVLQDVGCKPLFAEAASERRYFQYYKTPLLGRKEELPNTRKPTDADGNVLPIKPLIFELSRRDGETVFGKSIDLVFFDAAGEDMTDEQILALYDKFIPFASGIIFLIDPLQLASIRERIPEARRKNIRVNTADLAQPLSVITHIRDSFQKFRGHHSAINVPTAFVLSKSDMLTSPNPQDPADQSSLLSQHSPVFRQSVHRGGYNLQDGVQVDREVRDLLAQEDAGVTLAAADTFTPHAFFAVSATGSPPDSTRHFSTISPLRVVDPLFWVLAQLGFIDEIPLPVTTAAPGAPQGAAYTYARVPTPVAPPVAPPAFHPAPPPMAPGVGAPAQPGYWSPPAAPPAPAAPNAPATHGAPYDPGDPNNQRMR